MQEIHLFKADTNQNESCDFAAILANCTQTGDANLIRGNVKCSVFV